MRSFLVLLFCCYFSYSHAQVSAYTSGYTSEQQVPSQPPIQHQTTTAVKKTNRKINRPINTTQQIKSLATTVAAPPLNNFNKSIATAATNSNPVISGVAGGCVRAGDMLNFMGKDLLTLSNPVLTLNTGSNAIILKSLSITNTRISAQLPHDKRLQANHNYPVYLLEQGQLKKYQKTGLSIRTCPFISNDFKEKSVDRHEAGEILIFADKQLANSIRKNAPKAGYKILRQHQLNGLGKTMLVLSVDDQIINDVMTDLRQKYPAAEIDLNNHYQPTASPRIYAPRLIAWSDIKPCHSKAYKNMTIGIIDSHVDRTHPALARQSITVKNFLKKADLADAQHGTAIAVILAGNKPESGFQGLLPGIAIISATTIRKDRNGLIATTEGLVRSIDWMLVKKVRLINMSLSGTTANFILKAAFQRGIKKGLIIFAAAGNQGQNATPSYPAALPGVIAVTAIDAAYQSYSLANQGKYIDFSAPGVDIWTVDKGMHGKYSSGTSYAAPHALAVAALYLGRNPSLSRGILYSAMQADVRDLGRTGYDTVFGWGLVQMPKNLCH